MWIDWAARTGFRTYKVKISGKTGEDKALLSYVNDTLREKSVPNTMRVDGNQGYTRKTFFELVSYAEKERINVELFEQPLDKDDRSGLTYVCRKADIPVILDETVFSPEQAEIAVKEKMGHGINIKMAKSGIKGSEQIMKTAKKNGMKLMIGCMTETMTGLSSGIYMAAGTGAFDYVDLDGVHFIRHGEKWNDITIKGPVFGILS